MTRARVTWERQKVIALDTNIFIYHFEENPAYAGFTEPLFDRIESGKVRAVTSALTLHEVLTGAKRAEDDRLATLYRSDRLLPNLRLSRLAPGSRRSHLPAGAIHLPTPDTIQIATAIHEGAEKFVTNDARLKWVRDQGHAARKDGIAGDGTV
jgi:predicted nucleic acid-binding protein